MAVRRCKKADVKRIAIATGAAFLPSLSNMEGVYPGVLWMAEYSNSMVCDGLLLHFAHSASGKSFAKEMLMIS
jgi:T-complex protein 1 subunit alpha